MGHHAGSAEQCSVSADQYDVQSRGARTKPNGAADQGSHVRPAVDPSTATSNGRATKQSCNSGNQCYMKSLVQVLVWLLGRLRIETLSSMNDAEGFFLNLLPATGTRTMSLIQDRRWQSVINEWGEAHRQHDVCEFFSYLMSKSDCKLFAGSWKARTPSMAGTLHHLDEGLCTQPIILHMPQSSRAASPQRIQSLVDEWHRCVDRIHGLDILPLALLLQLHRRSTGAQVRYSLRSLTDVRFH